MNVGFVGLGAMGGALVRCLTKANFRVLAHDTDPTAFVKKRPWSGMNWSPQDSATFCPSISGCVHEATHLCVCLPNSQIVEAVVERLLEEDSTWKGTVIDLTSGDFTITQKIAQTLDARGIGMIDAAVSGGPAGAAKGTLSVMCGGESKYIDAARPILESLGTMVHLGPIGSGHAVKSVNNTLNSTHLLVAAEGLAALKRLGVCPDKALKAINLGSGRSLQTEVRIPKDVLTRRFGYDFQLGLMRKDVGLCQKLVDKHFPEAELLPITVRMMNEAEKRFGHEADYTECVRLVEERVGLELTPETK